MYNLSRTGRERATNIWPGFVDGLATLLLVLVFVLLVFMVGQFFLSTALTNRDTRLAELTMRLDELSDLLSLERQANEKPARRRLPALLRAASLAGAARLPSRHNWRP